MKKRFLAGVLAGVLAVGALTACGSSNPQSSTAAQTEAGTETAGTEAAGETTAASGDLTPIKVAASATPHAEILEQAKPLLAEQGYDLQVTVFNDYVQPNEVVESGDFDANYFQHIPYLESFNEEKGTHLVNAGGIHYEPFGIYPGTKSSLDDLAEGDTIAVVGPLGNGFTPRSGKSILIGGGIGIPPMLALAKSLSGEVQVVLGYRDAVQFLKEDFTPYASVYVSTEDGSVGTKGNVIDAIRAEGITADVIYACGPMPMLRGVKAFAAEQGIEAQISLEEHMACGIGACLGCVCTTKEKDAHSHVNNTRICKDGPVFDAQTVEI